MKNIFYDTRYELGQWKNQTAESLEIRIKNQYTVK